MKIGLYYKILTAEELLNKIRNPARSNYPEPQEDYDLIKMPCLAFGNTIRYNPQKINWVKHKNVFETLVFDIQTSYTLEEAKKIPLRWSEFSSIFRRPLDPSENLRWERHYSNTHYFTLIPNEKGVIFRGHLGTNRHAVRAFPGVYIPVVVPKHRDKIISINSCVVDDFWDDLDIKINTPNVDRENAITILDRILIIDKESFRNIKDSTGNPYYIDITFTKTAEYKYEYWVSTYPAELIKISDSIPSDFEQWRSQKFESILNDIRRSNIIQEYGEFSTEDNKVSIRFKLTNPESGLYFARTEYIHVDIGWTFITPLIRIV